MLALNKRILGVGMSKSKIFIGICLSFILGVFLGSILNVPRFYLFIAIAVCVSAFAVFFYTGSKKIAVFCLWLLFLAFGMWRIQISFSPNQYQNVFNSRQKLEGYIVEDVDIRIGKQLLTFQPNNFQQRILITTSLYQNYFYGDWVVVEGKIAEPNNFSGFDYKGYLERYNVSAVSSYPKILVLKNNQGNFVKYQLLKIKAAFAEHIAKYLEEPKASLLMGILIGARKTLPNNVIENFNLTGTSHVIAVSGYNISIIIYGLGFLAFFLGKRWSFWISFCFILAFIIISGASASVIRASVMGSLLLLSLNIGRMYAVTPSLCLAAAGMLVLNPKILYWDIGFQLSFAATLGIVYLLPEMEKLTESWPKFWGAKSIVFATLSATAATLPLILLHFGRLSIVALIANILILPIVPAAMLFGFLIAVPFASPGFALISSWLLAYILKITSFLASLPYSSVNLNLGQGRLILISLLPIGLCCLLIYQNRKKFE